MKNLKSLIKKIEERRAGEVEILEDDSIDTPDFKAGFIEGLDFCLHLLGKKNVYQGNLNFRGNYDI